MKDRLHKTSEYLAKNLETLRKKKNFSQMQLAKLATIPRTTLTHLESGSGNPTLSNLLKLSGVLQVSIEELLRKPYADFKLLKKNQIPVKLKARGAAKIYKILMDSVPGMEIDKMEIDTEGCFTGVPHTKGTKEYFYCEQGNFEIFVVGEKHVLTPGDLLIFAGDQAHSYRNCGKKSAIGFSVVAFL